MYSNYSMSVKRITNFIENGKTLAADGAWATMLYTRGLARDESPEKWGMDNLKVVREIAKAYVGAGSDIISTNTFGANWFRLASYGLQENVREYNRITAEVSKIAAGYKTIVTGSVGPTGKSLSKDEITRGEMFTAFQEQVVALMDGGVDAILIETMTSVEEAIIAIDAVKSARDIELICSFGFIKNDKGHFVTIENEPLPNVIAAVVAKEVDVIGANCGTGIDDMIEITKQVREVEPKLPLMVYPNAGIPEDQNGRLVFPDSHEYWEERIPQLIENRADIIGGCCGTTPKHIAIIRHTIDGDKYY